MELSKIQDHLPVDIQEVTSLYEFNKKLDVSPPAKWLENSPAGHGVKYIPIRIIETVLRTYFGVYQVEFASPVKLIANSVVAEVHLKVYHPVLKEWLCYAGVGAVPIQLQKGASVMEIDKMNKMAMQKNAPAALSFAVSNAAKKIGKVFGSEINDDKGINLGDLYKVEDKKNQRVREWIETASSEAELKQVAKMLSTKELKELYNQKLSEWKS